MKKFVHKIWRVNDRIAVIQLKPGEKKSNANLPKIIKNYVDGLKITIKTMKDATI